MPLHVLDNLTLVTLGSHGDVHFSIEFDAPPDFFTVDGAGRQKDSFQFYIDLDASPTVNQNTVELIIRGEEINLSGEIAIRAAEGEGGPHSGGWGPVLATVPYVLSGNTLSFDVPASIMGDPGAFFTYDLLVVAFGGTSDFLDDKLANAVVVGGPGDDSLSDLYSDDFMYGNGGDDSLQAGRGADHLDGGAGSDTLRGGTNDDTLHGGANADSLHGNNDDDELSGDGGNDTLFGSPGDDTLIGGAGADSLNGGLGTDTASYASAGTGVRIALDGPPGSGGEAAGDTLLLVENLVGSSFADSLRGSAADNRLEGGAAADSLFGGGGIDTLIGGAGKDLLDGGEGADSLQGGDGNDIYFVDDSGDVLVEESTAGAGTDLVRSTAATYTLGTNVENLALDGAGSIAGAGNGLANLIAGNAGDNELFGDDGNDVIVGGLGLDSIEGGQGKDIFRFASTADSAAGSADEISDFSTSGGDRIDVKGIDADTVAAGDQAFSYIGNAAFTGAGIAQLRWDHITATDIVVQADLDGNNTVDLEILLHNNPGSLVANDFVL
jgi:Ca2+-binding RTX toxin-like protein